MLTPRRSKRKNSKLKPVNVSLNELLSSDRMQRLSSIGILRHRWPDIVGTMMAERSEPIAIEPQQDNSLGLIIAVNHPVVAQHIRLLHEEIRKACFKHCQLQGLRKVWTKVVAGAGIHEEKKTRKINELSCHDLRKLAESLQDVKDKALRRAMFQAGAAQLVFQQ